MLRILNGFEPLTNNRVFYRFSRFEHAQIQRGGTDRQRRHDASLDRQFQRAPVESFVTIVNWSCR